MDNSAYLRIDRLEAIIDGTRAGTWEWNVQTGQNVINERWAEIVGYSLEEFHPKDSITHWRELVHPDDLLASDKAFEDYFNGTTSHYECKVRMRHKDGHWVWIHDRGKTATLTEDGKPEWVVGTHIDITSSHNTERLISRLSQTIPGILYVFKMSPSGELSFPYVSEKTVEFYGLTSEQVRLDPNFVFNIVHPDDLPGLMESIELSKKTMEMWRYEYRIEIKDRMSWLQGVAIPEIDEDGAILWYGIVTNIDKQKALEKKLLTLSITDELTGLHNRRFILAELEKQFASVKRYGETVSVALVDLDNFKSINDSYGHPAGDKVLIEFAKIMTARLRGTDIYGRFGGEEFFIIFPNQSSENAMNSVSDILEKFRSQSFVTPTGQIFNATFSAGITEITSEDKDVSELISRADNALYTAKDKGRNDLVLVEV